MPRRRTDGALWRTAVARDSGSFRLYRPNKEQHGGLPRDKRAMFLDCDRSGDTPGGGEHVSMLVAPTADVWLECARAGCSSASVTLVRY